MMNENMNEKIVALSDAELEACGVGADLVRLSVGIENVKDIIADLEQALKAVKA